MDYEQLPKRLSYGDVAMSSRRQGGQVWHCKDTDDFLEAPGDRAGQLGRPRLGPTGLEEDIEDRRSDTRSQPRNCRKAK
ncbi:hypothetical protein SprV_0401591800 [Sparganum proliferum]